MNNKYKNALIKSATQLDERISSDMSSLKYVMEIVHNDDEQATRCLCLMLSDVIEKDSDNEVRSLARSVKDNLVSYYGYLKVKSICSPLTEPEEEMKTLDELLRELDELVGLENVKRKVNDLIAYQSVQKKRENVGLHSEKNTMHLAFTGNPGTGKTSVARIVGKIYRHIGLLSKGHFIEVSRTDLIAGYQGQTALKVKNVIERAKGGVLFIDEAYSITENDHSDSYGRECLTELTKALEDYRNDLVVIVAGYTEPMKKFFDSNPGLRSRFNCFIEFEDYNAQELLEIFLKTCKRNDYEVSNEALEAVKGIIQKSINDKGEQFANGRLSRNLFEDMAMNHARRIYRMNGYQIEDLKILRESDIPSDL